jgi:hypothetical protein
VLFGRKLEKHSRWKLDHGNLVPMVVKVFFLLQSHFAGAGSGLTHFIGYASDMKEVLVSAKRIMQVTSSKTGFRLNCKSV